MSSRAGLRVDMGIKYLYIIDTLSREISHRIGACLTESGDFSAPLSTVEMTVRRAAYRKKDCEEMILIFSQSLLF